MRVEKASLDTIYLQRRNYFLCWVGAIASNGDYFDEQSRTWKSLHQYSRQS